MAEPFVFELVTELPLVSDEPNGCKALTYWNMARNPMLESTSIRL